MPDFRYQFDKPVRNSDQLQQELTAIGIADFSGLVLGPVVVIAVFTRDLTGPEVLVLTTAVTAHVPDPNFYDNRYPDRKSLRDAAAAATSDIDAYLAAADSGTSAQIQARDHAAVKRLAQMMKLVILRLKQID